MVSALQADVVLKWSSCWVQFLTTVKTDRLECMQWSPRPADCIHHGSVVYDATSGNVTVSAASTCLQDRATQEELDDLARSGDRMRRYVEHKKAETAFRLWDLDSDGRVLREKVVRGLLRCAHALSGACSTFCQELS